MKKPSWIKKTINSHNIKFKKFYIQLKKNNINTLCLNSDCPNFYDCFLKRNFTILIMGKNCSRKCSFCNLGNKTPTRINNNIEIYSIINMFKTVFLNKITVTSVTRTDIYDKGVFYFANFISKISKISKLDVLITDFGCYYLEKFLFMICRIKIRSICYNIETVKRLYKKIKPGFSYENFFFFISKINIYLKTIVKTGLMIGVGEKKNEIINIIFLLSFYVNYIVIGQYLKHKYNSLKVNYIDKKFFNFYRKLANNCRYFKYKIFPFSRSSI